MKKIIFSLFCVSFLMCSCEQQGQEEEQQQAEAAAEAVVRDTTVEVGGIRVSPLRNTPQFEDASLELNNPEDEQNIAGQQVQFRYEVENYELGAQTDRSACPECANSEDGQHIHLILNNRPYLARYDTTFEETLEPGHYVLLSFLSRSYHESVKNDDAYDLRQFTVGGAEAEDIDLDQPLMFYSRPKGEYEGEGAQRILLDFYLVNTDLAEDGHKVRATINGNEFMLVNWEPYVIEGLPMGEATIKLELLDGDNNLVDNPFNPEERTITLKGGSGS